MYLPRQQHYLFVLLCMTGSETSSVVESNQNTTLAVKLVDTFKDVNISEVVEGCEAEGNSTQ